MCLIVYEEVFFYFEKSLTTTQQIIVDDGEKFIKAHNIPFFPQLLAETQEDD